MASDRSVHDGTPDDAYTWKLFEDYFTRYGFAHHQIESFDHFLNFGITRVFEDESDIFLKPTGKDRKYDSYRLKFSDVYISHPMTIEEDRTMRPITPNEARQRDLFYDAPIHVTLTETINVEGMPTEVVEHKRVVIGRVPIMLRSTKCHLTNMTQDERVAAGECKQDHGGYFIIKGKERVLIAQIRGVYNIPLVVADGTKYKYIAQMRSMSDYTGHSEVVKAMIGLDDRTLLFDITKYIKEPIPMGIVFKALGYTTEREINNFIGLSSEKTAKYLKSIMRDSHGVNGNGWNVYLAKMSGGEGTSGGGTAAATCVSDDLLSRIQADWDCLDEEERMVWAREETVENALRYIGRFALHPLKECERVSYARQVVNHELFPHLGIRAVPREIGFMLGHIAGRLIATNVGMRHEDNWDDYTNKRVETSGILCYELFKQLFKKFKDAIVTSFEKKKAIPDIMSIVSRITIITSGLRHCFSTGKWGVPKSNYIRMGVSQILQRTSFTSARSHLRRLAIPIGKETKTSALRQINPSQAMFICPVETPEGAPVGIVLNFALFTRVSERCPVVLVRSVVEASAFVECIRDLPADAYDVAAMYTKVLVNGIIVGITAEPESLVDELITLRRQGVLVYDVSISCDDIDNTVLVFCDEGRLIRPVYTVRQSNDGDHKRLVLSVNSQKDGTNWDELLRKGCITYVDNSEVNCAVVAFYPSELARGYYTHCEISPVMMFGVMASLIPFPDHSQSPRNTYQSAMGKQAMSMFAMSHNARTDTMAHVLMYPQRSLVSTHMAQIMGCNDMPGGMNCTVAIACYTGFNQEDSIIVNKSAVDRGLFWATTYHCYTEEEKKHGYSYEKIMVPPIKKQKTDCNYSLLNEKTGIIHARDPKTGRATYVSIGDVIVGKTCFSASKDNGADNDVVDCSMVIKKGEEGYIDKILDVTTHDGTRMVKIKIRTLRIPEIGDKFACYSEDHDVLTSAGWKSVKDVCVSDKVACLITTPRGRRVVQYCNPIATQSYNYNGHMYRVKNDRVDLFVTPNHRMHASIVEDDTGIHSATTGDMTSLPHDSDITASRVYNNTYTLLTSIDSVDDSLTHGNDGHVDANRVMGFIDDEDSGFSIALDIHAWAAFVGAWFTHGRMGYVVEGDKDVRAVCICVIKDSVRAIVEDCCARMPFQHDFFPKGCTTANWCSTDKRLVTYFEAFACKSHLPCWCFQLDMQCTRTLLESMLVTGQIDERVMTRTWVTASEQFRDEMQRLCLHAGWSCVWNCVRDNLWKITIYNEHHGTVTVNPKNAQSSVQPRKEDRWVPFHGTVYCCTVPTEEGVIFVRRNGKAVWCGNSRSAQKGTIGIVFRDEDMPWTESGIRPDIILNPHAIPSRMTINQLMESVLGKYAALQGSFEYATPFVENSRDIAEQICDKLGMTGYKRNGRECMYNGFTGECMGDVFIGVVHYQRLKHLVSDKVHARSTGPVAILTRTPVDGRSRGGGLRVGEMERDAFISVATTRVLRERLFEQSAPYSLAICEKCGGFATTTTKCNACDGTDKVSIVDLPYVSKLLLQELNAMHIKTKIAVKK